MAHFSTGSCTQLKKQSPFKLFDSHLTQKDTKDIFFDISLCLLWFFLRYTNRSRISELT